MAENDTHYNGTQDSTGNAAGTNAANDANSNNNAARTDDNYGLSTPNLEFGQGGPVYPGNSSNAPVIPLPDEGAGGPVYPGNGSNVPVIPLPDEGAGSPVFPGSSGNRPGSGSGNISWPNIGWIPGFPNLSPQTYGQVRFLNASANAFPVTISIDGTAYAINSRFGTISNYDWISDGFHTVTVRRASGLQSILLQQNFPFTSGQKITMVLTDSASGGLEMIRIVDSGCNNLPYNSSCYRFANMTYSGSRYDLLLYGGTPVFRSVTFQTVTSYKQAVSSSYQFYVTNSTGYQMPRELPIIIIGAIGTTANVSDPIVSFQVDMTAGQSYTTYLIGNTWSDLGIRALTVED